MRKSSRFMGVLAVGALAVGVSVYAAPRVDGSTRGNSKSNASRLVTGEAAHLQAVADGSVAGGGAFISMTPVAPLNGGSYSGCSISGNTITCDGPERMWFDLTFGGWAGDLKTMQIGMSYSVLSTGAGAPLVLPPVLGCSSDSDCPATFGTGSKCKNAGNTECQFAFQDASRPVNPYGASDLNLPATANSPSPIRWGATGVGTTYADPGTEVYAGSLVVDGAPGSAGTYTLAILTDANTFLTLSSGSVDISTATVTPAIVSIPTGACCRLNNACDDGLTRAECDATGDSIIFNPGALCSAGCAQCQNAGGADPLCDDHDACTSEICNAGLICVYSPTFDPNTQCCNGTSGATSALNDGDACTDDFCDGAGALSDRDGRDAATAGAAAHSPSAQGTTCDDGNACTFADECDGANSQADGGCGGTDANTVTCTDDQDCLMQTGGALSCIDGLCFCTLTPPLTIDITPGSKADPNCFDDGDKVTATVHVGASLDTITGGELTLQYTPGCLDLNEIITVDPFNNILFVDDSVPGEVFVAVGIDLGGTGVSGGDFDLVSLSFTKSGGCQGCDLCFSDVNPRHTRLTNSVGQVVTVAPECSKEVRGNGDLTLEVPDGGDYNVSCANNDNSRTVNWDSPSASDTCAVSSFTCGGLFQDVLGNISDVTTICDDGACLDPYSGGKFPAGSATFCCSATNDCGDEDQQCWTVNINDETSLDVQLQLSPTMTSKPGDGLDRCIKFEAFKDCAQAPLVFSQDVTFGGLFDLLGKVNTTIKIPGTDHFECITARDQLHTLRSCYTFNYPTDCDADGVLHATFKGDPFFGGNWLVGGNLDGYKKDSATASINAIDITDFGMFVSQYPGDYGSGDTPCGTDGPNADINGDGLVDMLDFTFISMNFLEDSKDCCCIGANAAAPSGRTSISVRSLRANGMGDLAVADLNNDGVVNMDDMQLLLQGDVPTKGGKTRSLRTGAQR